MRPTIICAQADAHTAQIHRQVLTDAGYQVVPVHDGAQALAAAAEEGAGLLVVDAGLPGLDGFAVIERLRGGDGPGRTLPALLLSPEASSPETRRRVEAMGDVALLPDPAPLDAFVEQVSQLVKAPAARGPSRGKGRSAPPEKGSLREIHFGAILHALHDTRARGVLFVENGKKKKAIELRDGYPVAVKSNLVTECLGNMLARRGKLTQEQIDESLRRVKRGEGLQGEILVAMAVLDEDTVAEALREQAESKLLEIFEWRRGTYSFRTGKRLQRANTLSLSGSPADLILEGARRHVPISRVDDFLARHHTVFLSASEAPFHRFQSVDLHDEERAQIADLGSRPLGDYLDAPERVRRILYGLAMTEVLELSADAAPATSPAQSALAQPAPDDTLPSEATLRRELTALAQDLREKSYYEVLGLPTIADDHAVRAAYERQIERVHPDRYRHSSGAVRQVADEIYRLFSRAYESLCDAQARAAYAAELKRDLEAQRDQARSKKIVSAESAFQRGEAALRARDYEGALVFFGSALEQLPDEGLYRAYYGWCLHLCHPDNEVILREAIEHVQSGIKLAPDHEMPYLFLGRLYKVFGRPGPAERMFTRAVQIRSDCVEALRELRLLNMRRDKRRGLIGRILKKS
jgi:CheY-like chemotaxis protein/tetratricopeptide (TPR) repeat protein